jgi:SWI/SNF-related matrix-associated actin-dependent regulator of chromatin subfamily A3
MPPPTELTQAPVREMEDEECMVGKSDKINQLIHLLQLTPDTEKSLVFSQFTSFLDKVHVYINLMVLFLIQLNADCG